MAARYGVPVGSPRWLETHIWHAKRMHMKEMWGFVLPAKTNRCGSSSHARVWVCCFWRRGRTLGEEFWEGLGWVVGCFRSFCLRLFCSVFCLFFSVRVCVFVVRFNLVLLVSFVVLMLGFFFVACMYVFFVVRLFGCVG